MPQKIKKRHLLDYSILIPYLILCVLGLVMVFSSTSYLLVEQGQNFMSSVINQAVFWLISLVAISFIYKMKTDVIRNKAFASMAMIIVIALLLVVLVIGKEVNGAKGWLSFGPVNIQPAEFFKITTIWFLALKLSTRQKTIQGHTFFNTVSRPLVYVIVGLCLIALLPDFGNAAVITLIAFSVIMASGINYLYTLVLGIVGVIGSFGLIQLINLTKGKLIPAHVYSRFAIYQNPFKDEFNLGHQMVNGYYAIYNGGLFGRGLGNSIQKKGFLKFAHTDYIFAIVIEELGLIVALLVLALLFYMIARIFLVGIRSTDPFNSMMCIGIGSLFLIQVFVNLGGITGIIPLTGITFPFLSQGGSSLLMLSICVGFALNISADEKKKQYGISTTNRRVQKRTIVSANAPAKK